jgi:hypothetical protein
VRPRVAQYGVSERRRTLSAAERYSLAKRLLTPVGRPRTVGGFAEAEQNAQADGFIARTRASRPGVVAVKVAGKAGTYAPGPLPPMVTVIFDAAGQCGEARFTPPAACAVAGRRVSCR